MVRRVENFLHLSILLMHGEYLPEEATSNLLCTEVQRYSLLIGFARKGGFDDTPISTVV